MLAQEILDVPFSAERQKVNGKLVSKFSTKLGGRLLMAISRASQSVMALCRKQLADR